MSEKGDGIVNDKSAEKNGKVTVFISVIFFLIGLLMYLKGHSIIAFILVCVSGFVFRFTYSYFLEAYAGNVHLYKKTQLILNIIAVCYMILGGFIFVSIWK